MAPPDLTPSAASSSPGGAPAGYGRSCTNCSRAKCKCILRPSGIDCERCHRLGKECQPITATRKRVEKRHISSRTAQLEEKLDDLVSILRSTQAPGSGQGSGAGAVPLRNPYTQSAAQAGAQDHDSPTSRLDHLATAATASNPQATDPLNNKLNANYHQSDDQSEPTPAEAELYLQKFRGWMKNFPFMYLAPEVTAASLRQDQPFLWLCIMNLTSMSIPQMNILKERVRHEVADRMIIRHEPTLEVVLGLVALMSWATMNFGHGGKPFLVLYSQIAVSAAYELGLTRSPEEEHYFTTSFRPWGKGQPHPKPRTMGERRAVLSLWFLTSEISTFIGKSESLQWTPHMQDNLEMLEREREYDQDATLTSLIRLQLIGDEAHKLLTQDALRGGDTSGQTPSYVFRKGMLERLRTVREGIPPQAASAHVVQQHGYATEILINSLGQFKTSIPETQRIDALYSCLLAVRAWFDIFFAVPLSEVPGDPFSVFVQLAQAQVALYRLTTTEDPAWDKELLRNTADLLSILDRSIERFESMLTVYPLKAGNEENSCTLYMKAIKATKNVKAWWEPALSQSLHGMPTPNSQGMNAPSVHRGGMGGAATGGGMNMGDRQSMGQGMTPSANQMLVEPMNMDFPDLAWMSDVFMPWEG